MRHYIISIFTLLVALGAGHQQAQGQTAGQISIGGKVYGGGREGAILSGNTSSTNSTAIESVEITDRDFRVSPTAQASQVTINRGNIVGVFGGGEEGRAYGKTNVTVTDGTIGVTAQAAIDALDERTQKVNGNVFGAGDGNAAAVFGGSDVTIIGGRINGSVYGGGNEADLIGCSELDLQGGVYVGAVFGGARKSNIYGYTFVNIDGLNAKNDLHIIDVYGGNDIAGQIHPSDNWSWTRQSFLQVPFEIANAAKTPNITTAPADHVDNTWNAFILATEDESSNHYKTLVDNLYGGGNGDYDYDDPKYDGLAKPVIDRTYMQLEGGAYGNVYGGGNAATVAISTDICLLNASDVDADYLASLADTDSERFYTPDYQFNRVFGGNNKEPMAIRPNWYLEKATVNNLYSGGNAGPMTYFVQTSSGGAQSLAGDAGILVHVKSNDMTINNVYGGCRMADVDPNGHKGADMTINAETIDGYPFPQNYAARVLIEGGNINNVYGGNDVSGNVYYGSLVEIHSSINGNVYGAGNGSYAYTDNINLKDDVKYGDFYYDGGAGGLASAQALSIHRPNAAQSYVHVTGTALNPTYIGGAIYCGGNSATLRSQSGSLTDVNAELHIGSYVIADNVFLGSNGENMVKSDTPDDLLQIYKNGPVGYSEASLGKYNSMDLTDPEQFKEYMSGVEVAIKPAVSFDSDYADHSTKFGSLYCGGNVGSMSANGYFNLDFLKQLVIYNKLVGGCNNANVAKTEYNAFHMGGLTGDPDSNNNKVLLTISGLLLEPRVLTGNVTDGFDLSTWNKAPIIGADPAADMLVGGNIYGGCYASGYINGGVTINITENVISPNVFTESGITYDDIRDNVLASTLSCYGGGYGPETEIWGNVTVSVTGNGQIMKVYGGGEMGVVGKLDRSPLDGTYFHRSVFEHYSETDMRNISGYMTPETRYLSRPHDVAAFLIEDLENDVENGVFNTTVNLNANLLADSKPNVAKLYGGGFQGTVSGNTIVNLNRGRVYDAFGGASNADILGHTEMYVGKASAPQVTNNVYGGNDFGGLIVGHETYHVDNNKDGDSTDTMEKIVSQTYVEYNSGTITGDLFGGPCGAYEYEEDRYYNWDLTDPLNPVKLSHKATCKPQLLEDLLTAEMLTPLSGAGYAANSFVNVISQSTLSSDVIGGSIFGAGQGLKGRINLADERGSYVRLMSATKTQRTVGELSQRVYGAGFCSNTYRSLVDAHTGYFRTIFGGAHGITYQELTAMEGFNPLGHYETNYMGYRSAVRLYEMDNNQMDIYGGGANAGAQEAGVVLYGGQANNVYGASYAQGVTYAASVEVPETSTTHVRAIFGGAEGLGDEYPCDAFNTFVTWNSEHARVNDAIYGGNNRYRMTRNAYLAINKPVKNDTDQLTNVFGGGYGANTVTLYTSVGLQDGAEVANVYGGGNNGQVLDTPSFRYYLDDGRKASKPIGDGRKIYPSSLDSEDIYGYEKYLRDNEVIGFHYWILANYWDGVTVDGRGQPLGRYEANAHGHPHDLYFLSTQMADMKNTNVYIMKGARVAENAYGGGYGAQALVSGETSVKLLGGTVEGDIYGGGYGGDVAEYPTLIFPAGGQHELTMSATNVNLQGGIARNVYGGGLNGHVVGATHVTLGTKDQHEYDFYGTRIDGEYEHQVIYGDPIVERSLYGGGQMGHVYGTAYLTLNQGHVGYKYDASAEVDGASTAACYVENLDLNEEGDNFLDQNGNVFGAGYGEGASVDVTYVSVYGGTIRNSLYGGGEIAAVGRGTMRTDTGSNKVLQNIDVAGRTHIYMYNGLVQGDVFGGGRGYSYDLTGNEVVGKTLYTDGYVFGTTDVNIHGGTIGTPETVADGHGNVFGGGNIGYCFTDAIKHGSRGDGDGEGRYYTNAWQCTDGECGYIEYMHNKPIVCSLCGKSPTSTDANYITDFTQVNAVNESILSEDCRVIVSPYAQVINPAGIDIAGNDTTLPDGTFLDHANPKHFDQGDYVPTYYLDLLKDKHTDEAQWAKLSNDGVTIRNAVFAGGNVSSGSDKVYANAITVFGNATASVNDIFFRDLITIGTEHTGGIYGDGNLTFVDGYRELSITDYGTDYYSQQDHISLEDYNNMNDRERAYFELEYQTASSHTYNYYRCKEAGNYGGNEYARNQHITADVYNTFTDAEKSHWTEGATTYADNAKIKESEWENMTSDEQAKWEKFGFCSIYAGRLLNTIQRADFCGVFGSRLVLEGAQDRVPEVVDYTAYTINRVGELSLNKSEYKGLDTGGLTPELITHGNYFGMYNIVNYLGALTSDVTFNDVRETDNTDVSYKAPVETSSGTKNYGEATYYEWKKAHQADRKRNNGTCHNTVALAAGVYLELVEEPKTSIVDPNAPKDYGYITGVVQLDLINVMTGLGGGYVYAKNEHGARTGNSAPHENLSSYNKGAVNNSAWIYNESNRELIETSGNFIHNTKQIVDDCYPAGGRYDDYNAAPAHYWYIRGEFYVYDQYISAYTGSSTAYQENINLPLTITAGSNGRLDLIDIKQNFYAYWKDEAMNDELGENDAIVVNNITYGLNDIITYWDYMQLSSAQRNHFVPETYVAMMDYCLTDTFDGDGNPYQVIEKGEVILPADYELIKNTLVYDPEDIKTDSETGIKHMKEITMADVFHVSNAVSHDNGYILAVKLDNPLEWDNWYIGKTGHEKVPTNEFKLKDDGAKSNYWMGPTYYPTTSGVYGQYQYVLDDIVTKTVVDAYNLIPSDDITTLNSTPGKKQATVAAAYVAVTAAEYDYNTQHKNVQAGVGISSVEYDALDPESKAKFSPAYTCTSTFEEDASTGTYIYFAELIPATKYQELYNNLVDKYVAEGIATVEQAPAAADQTMRDHFDKAFIITEAGLYGGQRFEQDNNYRAIDTWATLSREDRQNFNFHYDALDVLYDPTYPATGEEGPGDNRVEAYDGPYWEGSNGWTQHQVYGAKQPIDYKAKYEGLSPLEWTDKTGTNHTLRNTDEPLDREVYEGLPNERRHYSAFTVETPALGDPYPTYYIVTESFISGGSNFAAGRVITKEMYDTFDTSRQQKIETFTPTSDGIYYICREDYEIGEKGMGQNVVDRRPGGLTYTNGQEVKAGVIIDATNYENLVNKQINGFTIHGNAPIETSTLYVNRESDIFDLSKDRVVTVVYQYKYEESDESGHNVEEITERHIINIHITFKSGVPTIGKLQDPSIVLPGQTVGLKSPNVTPGAYEILGGGWELFTNPDDAEKHQNGKTYINNATPMYWYQDGYYVAYYAKTYLGKTYSNSVPFKVANYHDIADVMADTNHYMYVDHPDVKRNSKIYIDNSWTDEHPEATKSEVDMLYDLFEVSRESTKKTIYVDVQRTDNGKEDGNPLYYRIDSYGNKIEDEPYTTTPTPYPVTDSVERIVPVFDNHARNCANLAIYMGDDVKSIKAGGWTPIGLEPGEDPNYPDGLCFMGNLHGMGHTISGLSKSLFADLCGNVYNLGVTGSFTKAGIADRVKTAEVPDSGDPATKIHGHVNSCWIYTNADPADVVAATIGGSEHYCPVVGVPNNLGLGLPGVHTLNCYFPEECGYPMSILSTGPNTTANSATLRQFNNGEVTYDLNGFYLNKRYSDAKLTVDDITPGTTTPSGGDNAIYKYWTQQADGTRAAETTEGYYLGGGSMHAYDGKNLGYVERLFADGDFVYKYGTIPLETNERYSILDNRYVPIWPDDYYFFGQQLTYGYNEANYPYDPLPSYVHKTVSASGAGKDARLYTTEKNNIVYRIPAYYRSSEKKMAFFNPYAVFADHIAPGYDITEPGYENVLDGRLIHPGLTAIDFTGFNDRAIMLNAGADNQKFQAVPNSVSFTNTSRNISSLLGEHPEYKPLNDGVYFAPITDYTTLIKVETHDITQNLLAYAPTTTWSAGTANTQTILRDYFNEPAYAPHYSGDKYRKVEALDASTISGIHGHLIMKENKASDRHYYYAASDHYLVDRQDFNAPMEYEFNPASTVDNKEYRMWYQRTPDNYADIDTGWEGVSLPFSAELVTTQDKGEITHFYNSALGADYTAGKTSGHEYWLREFTGVATNDGAGTVGDPEIFTAAMDYPVENGSVAKEVTSTFLWDYYYNNDGGKDANGDDYRHDIDGDSEAEQDLSRNYYGKTRTYTSYPFSVAGKPYIVGFPGGRYYEFDLSGTFNAQHTSDPVPDQLNPQIISFVSDNGITIRVSDEELETVGMVTPASSEYGFFANYLNVKAPASSDALNYYVLNADGSAFEKTTTPIALDGTGGTAIAAFRPYFSTEGVSNRLKAPAVRRIVFGTGTPTQFEPDEETLNDAANHSLNIYAKNHKIIVESTLEAPQKVRITTAAGQVITAFTIQPGERIATPVGEGIYITNLKKLIVE